MVLIFDLDDTLFNELDYVRSGFRVVSQFIENLHGIPRDKIFNRLNDQLEYGRDKIFDAAFESLGILSKTLIRRCVRLYRMHQPTISLFPEAAECLKRFGNIPLYIVTDGNINAQKNKLIALGIYNTPPIRRCFLTYRYGPQFRKPSPYCFFQIAAREQVFPEQMIYVGDNPEKDFIGIKPFGFKTIRVLTGQHRKACPSPENEAHQLIHSLDELTTVFIASAFTSTSSRSIHRQIGKSVDSAHLPETGYQ